jgi:hypothetical protein
MILYGEYHNTTIDGRDWWVAALVDSRRNLPLSTLKYDCIEECATEADAVAWLTQQLTARGMPVKITRR